MGERKERKKKKWVGGWVGGNHVVLAWGGCKERKIERERRGGRTFCSFSYARRAGFISSSNLCVVLGGWVGGWMS